MTHQSFHISNVLPAKGIGEERSFELLEGVIRGRSANSGATHVHGIYGYNSRYCSFKVDSGDYKLMEMAPYGEHVYAEVK